ncbi:histidine kinase [Desulfosporosinus fructosivorans]|uniref:Histidine kinase n=1 Tax=Desulfosporosinus fructosivorans TaxID=2018669 RepID=A0A4Z0QWS4_9FIRM|nr:histidine kinase [Desulfosporosinus fructosivorans]
MPLFLKIIASIFLLIYIINPKIGWKISEGWKYKNAEPSEVYLIINRILAIAVLIVIWLIVR